MKIVLCILALAAATLMAVGTAEAATPRQAASEAKRCLIKRDWSAKLADGGYTVNAEAPRERNSYPEHPWYSVAFYDDGTRTRFNEIRMGLNRKERRQATSCRKQALR